MLLTEANIIAKPPTVCPKIWLTLALAAICVLSYQISIAQANTIVQNRDVRQSAAALYKRAESRIKQQRFDDAREILDRATSKYPESGVFVSGVLTEPYYPHYLLGLINLELERYDDAINEFLIEERQGQ